MKKLSIYIMLLIPVMLWGQEERKYIREGYKAYKDNEFNKAEIDFRKAEEANNNSYIAKYNTSTAMYKQNNLEESGKRFSELMAEAPNDTEEAKVLHNLGNVLMDGQKYQEAAEAYKRSLKLNPKDDDTRYNLAYALEKLREQQQQQQKNKDQQQNDNSKDQNNKDKQNSDKQNQEQQEKQKQQQEQQQEQEQENQQQQAQQKKQELSKEEAERLLSAILQKEKDVKEKVDKKKAVATKIKTDKDW